MNFVYEQKTGNLLCDGAIFAQGFSGFGIGRNNPIFQDRKSLGPIPCGRWRIVGEPYTHPTLGPFVINLEPCEGTKTFNRDLFRIHGAAKDPKKAANSSHGCIVLPPNKRKAWWATGEREFDVVNGAIAPPGQTPTEK